MAKSTRRPPKKPTPIDSNMVLDEPQPDIQAEIPAEFQPAAAQAASQAPAKPPAKLPTFYETMNKVAKADWGPRANIYLYRVEPVIDRTRSGEFKFICSYAEPINDDRVMADYGSGRYKLMLNYRKAGADHGDLLDSVYIDILNMKFPPKIPLGEWVDDPKNKKWAWAKEAAGVPAATSGTAASTIVDAMKMVSDIRRDVREEMEPEPADAQSPSEMVQTFKAMKDILSPATATAAKDPLELATALATTMMQMKADNPVIDLYRDELKALREEMKEERAARAAQPVTPPKGALDQLLELANLGEKLDPLKKLFGFNGGGEAVRTGRTTALDVARDLGSKFFESDLASGVGQYLASLATKNVSGNGGPPAMNPAPQNGVQRPVDDFPAFIENVVNPALLRHYNLGFNGADFAGWLFDGYPNRVTQLQNFTHPMMPGLRGQNAIVQAYKNTPNMWPTLSSARPDGELAFVQFVHEFCQWKPEPNEPIDVETVDATAEEAEEGPERI